MNTTDMKKIKQIASDFFENEVKKHTLEHNKRMFPSITIDVIQQMYQSINQKLPWDSKFVEDAKSVKDILYSVDSKIRVKLFMNIMDYMSVQDYSEALMFTYATGLTGQIASDEWCKLFRDADKKFIMETDDYNVYSDMPDIVIAYRGTAVEDDIRDAVNRLSWSLNIEQADWFANREFNIYHKEYAVLLKADIPKERIIAYRKGEMEVLVDVLDYDIQYEIVKEYE